MPIIKRFFLKLALLFALASCDGADTWCFESSNDSYSDTNTIQTTVDNNVEIWAFSAAQATSSSDPVQYGVWVQMPLTLNQGQQYGIYVPNNSNTDQITIATGYTSSDNSAGTEYVIQASTGTPTLIADPPGSTTAVTFADNQEITVTIAECTTGSSSYGTTNPTKWTWSDRWYYDAVACLACQGTGGSASSVPYFLGNCSTWTQTLPAPQTGTFEPDCIAVHGTDCNNPCIILDADCTICSTYYTWGCQHLLHSFAATPPTSGSYPAPLPYIYGFSPYSTTPQDPGSNYLTYDTCPENCYVTSDSDSNSSNSTCNGGEIGTPTNPYICQFQDGSSSGYVDTNPTYLSVNPDGGLPDAMNEANYSHSEYCDGGYLGAAGQSLAWTPSNPGDDNSHPSMTDEFSSESIHETGNTDTCWNTGGYRLYAIQNGVQCPPSDADDSENCIEVWNCPNSDGEEGTGMAYNGETISPYVYSNGTYTYNYTYSFTSLGGPLWLQIIDPNQSAPPNESTLTTDIINNNTLISNCNSDNNILYPYITNNLISLNNTYYVSGEIALLIQEAQELDATGDISDPTAQNYMQSIVNYLDGFTNSSGAFVSGVYQSFGNLNNLLTQSNFDPSVTSSWEPYVFPTTYAYSTGSTSSNNCVTTVSPTCGTANTSSNVGGGTCTSTSTNSDICSSTTTGNITSGASYWTPTTYPTPTTTSAYDIYDLSGNAILQAQALIAYLSPSTGTPPTLTGSTTSDDLINYCNSLISTLQAAQSYIANNLEIIQSQIDYNNAEISALDTQNDNCNAQILNSNTYNNSDMVGGYTVYITAGPLIAQYGQYLKAILVTDGSNPNSATADLCNYPVIFDYSQTTDSCSSTTTNTSTSTQPLYSPDGTPVIYYTPAATGTVWMKIFDPDDNYNNNSGSYMVDFTTVEYTSGFSTMMTNLISTIKSMITKTSENIYLGTVCYNGQDRSSWLCLDYINSIHILLNMYVIIYGMMYILGLIKIDYVDFIVRVVKIAVVITLLQPYSFSFFNQYFFAGFYNLSNTLVAAATGAPASNPFDFITQTVNVLILDQTTYFKIIGLLFQGLLGIVAFIFMFYGCISFILALFNAFIMYMTSFIGMGICIALAPIFLIFLLFKHTHHLFDNWFRAMVRLTMVPVILFVGLVILNGMLASLLQSLLNYAVCYKCTMPFTFALPGYPSVGDATLFCVSWFSKWGIDNVGSFSPVILMTFPLSIAFCIITEVMRLYSDKLAIEVASGIVGKGQALKPKNEKSTLGLNPFGGLSKGMKKVDYQMEKIAVRSGIAANKKEYKKMRNRALRKGLPELMKASFTYSAFGLPATIAKYSTKLFNERTKDTQTKQLTPAEQKVVLQNKQQQAIKESTSRENSQTKQAKFNKKATKLQSKIEQNDRKQLYTNNKLTPEEQAKGETRVKLETQLRTATTHYNNYMRNINQNPAASVQERTDKVTQRYNEARQKLQDFRKDPEEYMKTNPTPPKQKAKEPPTGPKTFKKKPKLPESKPSEPEAKTLGQKAFKTWKNFGKKAEKITKPLDKIFDKMGIK